MDASERTVKNKCQHKEKPTLNNIVECANLHLAIQMSSLEFQKHSLKLKV